MLRTHSLKLLLVFALLFAQHGALTHSVTHWLNEHTQEDSVPQNHSCTLCVSYAQLGNAITHSDLTLTAVKQVFDVVATYTTSSIFTFIAAFAARAPPLV